MNFPAAIKEQVDLGNTSADGLTERELDRLIGLLGLSKKPSEQSECVTESAFYDDWLFNLFAELASGDPNALLIANELLHNVRAYMRDDINQAFKAEIERRKEPTTIHPDQEHIDADNRERAANWI